MRHALRSLLRSPTYTVIATLTLALAIGATTGVVSIVDAALFRALPYRDAEQLAMVLERSDRGAQRTPSYPTYQDMCAAVGGPIAGLGFARGWQAVMRTDGGSERVIGAAVTGGFFQMMGTPALRGRVFSPADESAGAPRVAVIAYDFWRHRFGADPAVIGRTLTFDSASTTVIGVMPPGFAYPSFASFWLPIAHVEATDRGLQNRGGHADSRTIIRLRSPGDSAAAATAIALVQQSVAMAYPDDAAHWTGALFPSFQAQTVGNAGATLYALAGAAILVLLLACVNVATLTLVRATGRGTELAVRVALGADRPRLVRGLLSESAIVVATGAAGGVLLAALIVRSARLYLASGLPRAEEMVVDGRVMAVAGAATIVAAVLAGVVPAIRATRLSVAGQLRSGGRTQAGSRAESRTRSALVAFQCACAVVLLVGAGLLVRSFRQLNALAPEYDADRLATAQIFPPSPAYDTPAGARALYDRLRAAVAAVPSVTNVAVVNHMPGGGNIPTRVDVPGRAEDRSSNNFALYRTVSPEYLATLGLTLEQGRWFTDADMRAPNASGFVVNHTMAYRFFPNGNAVGQVITLHRSSQERPDVGQPISGPVLGVISDVHSFGPEAPVSAEAFVPYTREVWPWITLVARADNLAAAGPAIRTAILSVDPNIPVAPGNTVGGVQWPTDNVALGRRAIALATIAGFAVAAVLIAAIGLYGVVAAGVTQRTREFGIRMALGATSGGIARLVIARTAFLVAGGVAGGLAAAAAGGRFIRPLLFDTKPIDPLVYAAVPGVLLAVALAASWWPARRAAKVEPTIAMRAE